MNGGKLSLALARQVLVVRVRAGRAAILTVHVQVQVVQVCTSRLSDALLSLSR